MVWVGISCKADVNDPLKFKLRVTNWTLFIVFGLSHRAQGQIDAAYVPLFNAAYFVPL